MPALEITAVGFDGGTDETDDRILWVWSESEEWLRDSLKGAPHAAVDVLHENFSLEPHQFDFIMPKDVQALHDRLRFLAGIPLLSQMVRGREYMHPTFGRAMFVASDPDDGAYLIFKFWDEEADAQDYFACEASDLRFLPPDENQRP